MRTGVSIGPYLDRLDSLPSTAAFAEVAVGEGEIPRDSLDADAVAERLSDNDLGAVVHLPYRQPLSTPVERIDDATLSYLDGLLSTAAAFGAEKAVAHPSARGNGYDRLVGRLSELAAAGRSHGVPVCFETVGYAGGPALDRVGNLAVRADAAVCLDVGYAYLETGTDGVVDFLGSYGDVVEHLHVHGTRHRGDTHIPVGSGDVDYDVLGDAIADTVPDATATVEVFTDDPTYLAASVDRFREAVGHVPTNGQS